MALGNTGCSLTGIPLAQDVAAALGKVAARIHTAEIEAPFDGKIDDYKRTKKQDVHDDAALLKHENSLINTFHNMTPL